MSRTPISAKVAKEYIAASDFEFFELENCDISYGAVKNRKGFEIDPKNAVFKISENDAFEMSLHITDCFISVDGKHGRVAINISENLMGSATYYMMLLCEDLSRIPLGYIEFSSNGGPNSFTVFCGKANSGIGVYFLARQGDDFITIRELGKDKSSWALINDSLLYAPTILAHGRGEAYHTATVGTRAVSFPSPTLPEAKNLMTPRFKANFTTDGASSGFTLPLSNLDDAPVYCELNLGGKKYSWQISAGQTKSSAVKVEETEVCLYVERGFGRVYFRKSTGEEFKPALSSAQNNLCVTAYKTEAGHINKIGAMASCGMVRGSHLQSKSPVTFFYGNRLFPSLIAFNSPNDPLYFPENTCFSLGFEQKKIAFATLVANKLLVIKDGEIYTGEISVKTNDAFKISFKRNLGVPILPIDSTIKEVGGSLFFLSRDNAVWEISDISLPSAKTTKVAELKGNFDFALALEDKYLLIKGNLATVIQKTKSGYAVGKWHLPARAVGGTTSLGEAVIFFEFYIGEAYMVCPARYTLDLDTEVVSESLTLKKPIKASMSIKLTKEKINAIRTQKITLFGSGTNVNLKLIGGKGVNALRRSCFKDGAANFYVGALQNRDIAQFSFEKEFSVSGIYAEYKQKVRK